jgi:Serine dehydrogenase proteinase
MEAISKIEEYVFGKQLLDIEEFENEKIIVLDGTIGQKLFDKFNEEYIFVSPDEKLTIEITTQGGDLTYAYRISQILLKHKGDVTVRVPDCAFSAGTIIALAAKKIVLSETSCLGPIDPYGTFFNVFNGLEVIEKYNKSDKPGWWEWAASFIKRDSWIDLFVHYVDNKFKKINDNHKSIVMKLLAKYPNAETIYNFFAKTYDHNTPILFSDVPQDLNLPIEVDPLLPHKVMYRQIVKKTKKKQNQSYFAMYDSYSTIDNNKYDSDDYEKLKKLLEVFKKHNTNFQYSTIIANIGKIIKDYEEWNEKKQKDNEEKDQFKFTKIVVDKRIQDEKLEKLEKQYISPSRTSRSNSPCTERSNTPILRNSQEVKSPQYRSRSPSPVQPME